MSDPARFGGYTLEELEALAAKRMAESFPVWHFIFEEMEERGWSTADMALRMGGKDEKEIGIDQLSVELCSVDEEDLHLGKELSAKLGVAFGVSPEFFLNLDTAHKLQQRIARECCEAVPALIARIEELERDRDTFAIRCMGEAQNILSYRETVPVLTKSEAVAAIAAVKDELAREKEPRP